MRRGCGGSQHGNDAAMGCRRVTDVELAEDVADVAFDGLGAEHEQLADTAVGVALGHELEHFALAVGEL
jgi:hypothetical protein